MKIRDVAKRASRMFRRRPKPIKDQVIAHENLSMRANRRSSFAVAMAAAAAALAASNSAKADTLFTDFAFPSATGTANRTMPERLDDVINVKDHQATGDGTTNDTSAIQSAINAAANKGTTAVGNKKGATVFFPPGAYLVSNMLTPSIGPLSISLIGSGRKNTHVFGTVDNLYIIDSNHVPFVNDGVNFDRVQGMSITNNSTTNDSGALAIRGGVRAVVEQCDLKGFFGCDAGENTYNTSFRSCTFNSLSGYTGIGLAAAQVGIYDCTFNGWGVGARLYNVGHVVTNCTFEANGQGLVLGSKGVNAEAEGKAREAAEAGVSQGASVMGNKFINNNLAINITSCNGFIAGNYIFAEHNGDGVTAPQRGIYLTAGSCVIMGNELDVAASVAVMDLSAATGNVHFIGYNNVSGAAGAGVNWLMPITSNKKYVFFGHNPGQPAHLFLFSELPSGAEYYYEGEEYDIIDSNTATWGAVIAGSGSNRVKGRFDGATGWTVSAK